MRFFLLAFLGALPVLGVTPVLNDGSVVQVLSFRAPTKVPLTTFTEVSISVSNPRDIISLSLIHHRHGGNRPFSATQELAKKMKLQGKLDFPPGNHLFLVEVIAKENTHLSKRLKITVDWMRDSTGKKHEITDATANLRFAYPIHHRGQFGCHTNRIPGIAKAKDGSLLAVFDMRYRSSRDLQGHMDIGLRRSTDQGQNWSLPRPIMDMGTYGRKSEDENGCSDPCILVDENTGEIFVFAVWTHGRPNTHQWVGKGSAPGLGLETSSQLMVVQSSDHGLTWSEPKNLTKELKNPEWYLFAPAPGNGITLKNGMLVIPSQGRDAKGLPFSNITYSKDHGKTWQLSAPARTNTTECAVVELSDGSLMLNMRDNRNRKHKSATNGRAVAVTRDLGETWEVHSTDHSALPEPVCMASLIRHKANLLFSNPNHKSSRTNVTLRASSDDGLTWPHKILLDSAGSGYGYSSLVMVDEDTVGIIYESSQADLIFQRIKLKELIKP
ncbi:glycoside hydrolase [bacterium]|nr:glycoside hydrolase [bacterium]MDB4562572.1 glycoside hydrolase [Akkermansiaceae bacterium]